LKSIDESLKNNPKKFWNCVYYSFRKNKSNCFQLVVDGTHLVEPSQVAEVFASHFKSVYDTTASKLFSNPVTSFDSVSSDNLSLFTDGDVCRAIRWLKPTKSAGLDGIPGFMIKGCIDIFVPLLNYIFNLSLSQQLFPSSWKQAAVVPIFKKGSSSLLAKCCPISILNNFSKVFEFVIHDHVSHYVWSKLNCCQYGCIKSRSTTSNFVMYLDYITL
jgi:hypothetical protein